MKPDDPCASSTPTEQAAAQFSQLFARYERQLRAFVRSLLSPRIPIEDVMQEVGLACWKKFPGFENSSDFLRWGCVVARYEVLRIRRKVARDRLQFDDELVELLADDAIAELDLRDRERKALAMCLEQLAASDQSLVLCAHTPRMTIAEIADATNQNAKRLYRRVATLRHALLACVESRLARQS